MNRTLTFAVAVGVTLATAGVAVAQPAYGPNAAAYYYNPYYAPPVPGYGPDAAAYYYNPYYAPSPDYVAPAAYPPVVTYSYGYYGYTGTHTDGGGSRAYPGGQKTN